LKNKNRKRHWRSRIPLQRALQTRKRGFRGSETEKEHSSNEIIEKMEEEDNEITSKEEQEEALVALIEHRTREVNNLRHRLAYTKNQVIFFILQSKPLFLNI